MSSSDIVICKPIYLLGDAFKTFGKKVKKKKETVVYLGSFSL